jgi:hypothetical protein
MNFNRRMILPENRFPSRITSGTCFVGIMRYRPRSSFAAFS